MSVVTTQQQRVDLEANIMGVLAHVLKDNGQVLSNCIYSSAPITATNNLAHLGQRAAEAFISYLYAQHGHCSPADLNSFLSLRRKVGQSAQDLGNLFLDQLRFLCNTSNGLYAPPVTQNQSLMIQALGGKAEQLDENLHSGIVAPMPLEQIIQRVYEHDQRTAANILSTASRPTASTWDIDTLTTQGRSELQRRLTSYTAPTPSQNCHAALHHRHTSQTP